MKKYLNCDSLQSYTPAQPQPHNHAHSVEPKEVDHSATNEQDSRTDTDMTCGVGKTTGPRPRGGKNRDKIGRFGELASVWRPRP